MHGILWRWFFHFNDDFIILRAAYCMKMINKNHVNRNLYSKKNYPVIRVKRQNLRLLVAHFQSRGIKHAEKAKVCFDVRTSSLGIT